MDMSLASKLQCCDSNIVANRSSINEIKDSERAHYNQRWKRDSEEAVEKITHFCTVGRVHI